MKSSLTPIKHGLHEFQRHAKNIIAPTFFYII